MQIYDYKLMPRAPSGMVLDFNTISTPLNGFENSADRFRLGLVSEEGWARFEDRRPPDGAEQGGRGVTHNTLSPIQATNEHR